MVDADPSPRPDRRRFLRHFAGGALATGALYAVGADAQPRPQTRQQGQSARRIPQRALPTLSPHTAQNTERAIAHYESIVARGGWPYVPPVDRLRIGASHDAVAALRQRLAISGDIDPRAGGGNVMDAALDAGLRRFQYRHGMAPDGVIGEQTFTALNISARVRLTQLRTNLVRLRSLSGYLGERFVVCNIPAAQIEAVENGAVVSLHAAVVGKPDRPSPDILSRIVEINFNPFWTVPVSIVRRDLIPKMQAEPDYLFKNRIRILDARGNELSPAQIDWYSTEAVNYRFKQDPGDFNSLGSMRINFPSAHGVYMHDTPFKNLFGDDFRFHSSGCVRVQDIRQLAGWLLRDTPGWSRGDIDRAIRGGARRDARVRSAVPLYWVYITGWAGPDGMVQFRDDIYSRDGAGRSAAAFNHG